MMGVEGVDQRQKPHSQGAEALFGDDSEMPGTPPTQEEKTIALIAHVGGIFTWWLIPLLLYVLKRNDSRFVADQAKEALNFNITMMIASLIAGVSIFMLVGFALLPLVLLYHLIGAILAAVSVNQGKMFRYRYCLRLVK